MNTPEIIQDVIEKGAVKLAGVIEGNEVARVEERRILDLGIICRLAPSLGSFIDEFVSYLPVDPDVVVEREYIQAWQPELDVMLHVDSPHRRGMSMLIPLDGPAADFYYAEEQLYVPSQLHAAQHFRYQPGDIAIIRQRINTGDGYHDKASQIYHTGMADGGRELLICDFMFDAPLQPCPTDAMEAAA